MCNVKSSLLLLVQPLALYLIWTELLCLIHLYKIVILSVIGQNQFLILTIEMESTKSIRTQHIGTIDRAECEEGDDRKPHDQRHAKRANAIFWFSSKNLVFLFLNVYNLKIDLEHMSIISLK